MCIRDRAARTLIDVMRGVVERGTGAAIRSRYGIRADVAGKTGTTQGDTDGWFILMQPELVAGAWVGFDDGRVTLGSDWGQGARSALPIVGDFYQRAIRARLVDTRARFATEAPPSAFDTLRGKLNDWYRYLFEKPEPQKAAPPPKAPRAPVEEVMPASEVEAASEAAAAAARAASEAAASAALAASAASGAPFAPGGASAPAMPPLLPPSPPPAAQPDNGLPNDNAPMSPTPTPDAPGAPGAGGGN